MTAILRLGNLRKTMYNLGFVGCGFVGNACSSGFGLLLGNKIEIREYDKFQDLESLESVTNNSDILFVAVPTPMLESGACDISVIQSVCEEIDQIATKPKAIIVKSTVPPGTVQKLQDKYPKHTFVFSPEFLTEKRSFEDFLEQDRIILGFTSNKQLFSRVDKLFQDFAVAQKKPAVIVRVPSEQAEMLKYMTNAFLATKIAFCNEIYDVCAAMNIDYNSIVDLLKLDKRIGFSHLAVPGSDGKRMFGGKCLPKDLNSLIFFAKENGVDPLLLDTVWTKNIMLREPDWENIPGATTKNMDFKKK